MEGGIYSKLAQIQRDLKAPKGQFNSFGKYNYRSCEDILEAVKPLLGDAVLTISDDIVLIGNRYYVRATATLATIQDVDKAEVTAYAREEEDKKGMDASQITGAASSYARKYALNGLFLIDDTKDADTQDNTKKEPAKTTQTKTEPAPPPAPLTEEQLTIMKTQMATWFETQYGPEAATEFEKMTGGKLKNPLTIKSEQNVTLAYDKYMELKKAVENA